MKAIAMVMVSALALAACAREPEAPARTPISAIDVGADLGAISDARAAAYWTHLDTDLRTALANQFVNDLAPTGDRISVDVDELSLAESYETGFGENSTLRGTVVVTDRSGASLGNYNVTATMAQVAEEAGSAAPTSTEFYHALVTSFAKGVDQAINPAPAP